jgi:hypothetical protein
MQVQQKPEQERHHHHGCTSWHALRGEDTPKSSSGWSDLTNMVTILGGPEQRRNTHAARSDGAISNPSGPKTHRKGHSSQTNDNQSVFHNNKEGTHIQNQAEQE